MKILFLTPQLPYPPQKGTTLRNYNLIAHLASEKYTLALLSFTGNDDPALSGMLADRIAYLRRFCAHVETVSQPRRTQAQRAITTLSSLQPDMALRLQSSEFSAKLRRMLNEFQPDIVQFEGIEMARYLPEVQSAACSPKTMLDDHNAEYVLQQRAFQTDVRRPRRWVGAAYSFIQWQKLRRWERELCRTVDQVVAVSDADAAALRRLAPGVQVAVVPNGIDTAWQTQIAPAAVEDCRPVSHQLIFTGTMDFRPNIDAVVWFCQEVLPQIRAVYPELVFVICGNNPSPRVRALERPGVVVTGSVADTRPYIAASTIYVVPLRIGGGTRFKILEAMASGVPIVSTPVGAEGFDLAPEMIQHAATPSAFAEAVLKLLSEPALSKRQAEAARCFVAAHYDWKIIAPRMGQIWDEIAAGRPNPGALRAPTLP